MRDELHLMELVDRYLDGEMAGAERVAFEERMRGSNELRSLVDDQRALREGLQRVQLRGALTSAHRGWMIKRWAPWVAAGLVVIFGAYWFMTSEREGDAQVAVAEVITPASVPPAEPTLGMDPVYLDSAQASEELNTQVESVFVRTIVRTQVVGDTLRGEGRVVTHLITQEPRGSSVSAPPAIVDVDEGHVAPTAPVTISTAHYDAEDKWTHVTKADSADCPQPEQKELLARVERLENATKPMYPGGMEEMQRYLDTNVKQPRGNRSAGMVMVGFTVNKKGEVVNAEVVRGMGRAFDAEALRAVSAMPAWEPSRLGDRPVKSHVEVPVRFPGSGKKERVRESRSSGSQHAVE